MAYQVEGQLLEVCTCNILCPCWVGEDPDGGRCDGLLAWRVDRGTIDGVNVSGLTFALLCHIPGNILKGNWSVIAYVDEKANARQQEALLNVWTGKLGGPIADLAKLVGKVLAVERVPITATVKGMSGTLKLGGSVEAAYEPYLGASGLPTALHDTIFTTIPGSPAYVAKASTYKANVPAHGFRINLQGHNAVAGSFRFQG